MKPHSILIIGAGIGGLTAAIALGRKGFAVEMIEKDPDWTVYGVGIIQQSNVVRAMDQLGLLDDYLDAGFGFDHVEVYGPDGTMLARVPSPKLVEGRPANVGVRRTNLQKVLGDRAKAAGAAIRLGVTATNFDDDGEGVTVGFSDGSEGRYDLVIGADGLYSDTRKAIFPDAPAPRFTGQSVWRHNFPRPEGLDSLHTFVGPITAGLVPLTPDLVYMFLTTAEPGNPRYAHDTLAASMRAKLAGAPAALARLAETISDDDEVVYKPLETLFLDGDWHKGRIVLLGDAVHATTPHLGQGAGMAIEDAIVLAEEIDANDTPEAAFAAFRERRFERCKYIVESSLAICRDQLGEGPHVDQAQATAEMFGVVAQPI